MDSSNGTNCITHTSNGTTQPNHTDNKVKVAIIGGGIVGCVTAFGLLRRGVSVKLYEQARSFREIGAGVAFTTNAQTCMELTDPRVLAAMKTVSTKNALAYYTYVDGYHAQSDDPNDMTEKELFQLFAGKTGFDGCHRAHFLDELVKYIPEGVVEFQKRLESYAVGGDDEEITLRFEDGTTATADAGE
jgi:salicylate hydroxylase